MIICQTPFRVSFLGGGTDWPAFFRDHGGAVLGGTIDQYLYHCATRFPSRLFDYAIRLAYRKVECVRTLDEIEHRPFREILRHFGIARDIEISLASDLPASTGLGASSSFTVGLIHVLTAFQGRRIAPHDLASAAIDVEHRLLGEAVGCQDQVFAAYGGLSVVEFARSGEFTVHPIDMTPRRIKELTQSLLLYFTGQTRPAQEIEREKIARLAENRSRLLTLLRQVDQGHSILTGVGPLDAFGSLLDQAWQEKRALGPRVSNPEIDRLYDRARAAGALGGKLLGAGGGGFLLLYVPPERQPAVQQALADRADVKVRFNSTGSQILYP
jgi:D-glycero-alpha-D-manno-heptose-7-phosphate kinase